MGGPSFTVPGSYVPDCKGFPLTSLRLPSLSTLVVFYDFDPVPRFDRVQ